MTTSPGIIRIRSGKALEPAIDALRAGETVIYPTETLYGLGAAPFVPGALDRLFEIKEREAGKPVALIAADADMAFALASVVPPAARRLARIFWPGPLTLVLPARPDLPSPLIGNGGGVGVRVSPHPIARSLSHRLGTPITATSANLAGQSPARTPEQALLVFGDKIKVIVEDGDSPGTLPSMLVEIALNGTVNVLREGALNAAQIRAALHSFQMA
jgi:L-threonylcarbamoyladenylate synthase